MDGYTAFGASIAVSGYKKTLLCPAPVALVGDTDIIAAAPRALAASGYADLLGKVTAGADWMIAHAVGVEPIHPRAWSLVQKSLKDWTSRPHDIARGNTDAVERLMEGLVLTGLAMQAYRNSRPASGAEHQFSHLWEMEHLSYGDMWLSHGFKVGIGSIAVAALYQRLLSEDLSSIDVERLIAQRPTVQQMTEDVRSRHTVPVIREKAVEETTAKLGTDDDARHRLTRLRDRWPTLKRSLDLQLIPPSEMRDKLSAVGCPVSPTEIGIDRRRLRRSYSNAREIRRRYTGMDMAAEAGVLERCIDLLFADGGFWEGTA